MAANQLVQARIDGAVKEEAAAVLAAMGLTVSDAVRLLLTHTRSSRQPPLRRQVVVFAHRLVLNQHLCLSDVAGTQSAIAGTARRARLRRGVAARSWSAFLFFTCRHRLRASGFWESCRRCCGVVACRRAEILQTANEPQRPAAPMMPVRALPTPIAEPGNNLHRQHRQQRDRDPDDGLDIQSPGRMNRHRTASVDTPTAGRNPPRTRPPVERP